MARRTPALVLAALIVGLLTACALAAGVQPVPEPSAQPIETTTSGHVTSAGTAFTVQTVQFEGNTVTFGFADRDETRQDIPVLLYTHGAGGTATQFAELQAWTGLRDWIIDNGWAWVEATGGGEYSWGNQAARTSYEDAFIWVYSKLNVGKVVVLGRSMGGIVASWLATESPIVAPRTSGLILNSGLINLADRYSRGTDESQAQMRQAFGVDEATEEAFDEATKEFDPMLAPVEVWEGINVLQLIGTNDTSVPSDRNALALRERWSGRPALDLLDVRQGGDHSPANGSYLQLDAMTSFLNQVVSPQNP